MNDDEILIGLCILIALFLGTVTVCCVHANQLERKCLAAGYPNADYRLVGPSYCIKRTNQTDEVISEEKLK